MRVGSLVICTNSIDGENLCISLPASDNIIYTVRRIRYGYSKEFQSVKGICLEEVINNIAQDGQEWAYIITDFREVQPPLDLSELMTEVNELSLQNV